MQLFRPYGTSCALIIAIGEYPVRTGYRNLPSAFSQARELEKALRPQGFAVLPLLPLLLDRNATRANIKAAIRMAPAKAGDRLLFYFGGHGDDQLGF